MDRVDNASRISGLTSPRIVTAASGTTLETAAAIATDQSLATTSTVASKGTGAAGISLDRNAATGDFTLRLSPANLTANRRLTLPDADTTITGGGTLALGGYTLTVPATGTAALLGTAQTFSAMQTFGAAITSPYWRIPNLTGTVNGYTLGTAGGPDGFYIYDDTVAAYRFTINDAGVANFPNTTASTSTTTGALTVAGGVGVGGAGYFGGPVVSPAATTSIPSIRLPHGTAPSSPTDGDMWTTTAGLYVRINGATIGPLS